MPGDGPFRVGFLLLDGFALLAYAAAIEPLRAANRLAGRPLYTWRTLTPAGSPVTASNGLAVLPDAAVGTLELDLLLVCASDGAETFRDRTTLAWLRRLARAGTRLGGISGGVFVLARAGLLAGRRCTTHWVYEAAFAEHFPELQLTGRRFEIDRDRLTCAGGIAALDMLHAVIEAQHGPAFAAGVTDWYVHTQVKDGDGTQRPSLGRRLAVRHEGLARALDRLERTATEPLDRAGLARAAGVSPRQLDRLFRAQLGRTVRDHQRELRLERARQLLQRTAIPVLEVALACGFASASELARAYRRRFGHAPRDERRG